MIENKIGSPVLVVMTQAYNPATSSFTAFFPPLKCIKLYILHPASERAADSEFRYRAGLVHVLGEASENGHCYLPQPELIELALEQLTTDVLSLSPVAFALVLNQMALGRRYRPTPQRRAGKRFARLDNIGSSPSGASDAGIPSSGSKCDRHCGARSQGTVLRAKR